MKKKEKQMGNITETGHFEKLIKAEYELMQLEEELDQQALERERKDSEEEDSNQEISKLKSLLIDLKKEIRNVQFYEDGELTTDELLDGVVEKIELGLMELLNKGVKNG